MSDRLSQWLEKLGYTAEPSALHMAGQPVSARHPYALELQAMLRPTGSIQAQAVFDVEGVPTVVFVGDQGGRSLTGSELDDIRKRIWNQNLASIVISVEDKRVTALPARRLKGAGEELAFDEAWPGGSFSAAEVQSSNISRRLPRWFDVKARVDRKLLDNLSAAVSQLETPHFSRRLAELLLGQVLFVSYLEHRGIVGSIYRERRGVDSLHPLIADKKRDGVNRLIENLRADFNGDFLTDEGGDDPWLTLSEAGFETLDRFLRRTNMVTGQEDFWNYDFSFIPVELLSGLYEEFLTPEEQEEEGAYYTPRHLATLAVDQAFEASPDPLSELIFDGACGSGILLTTAYRKLIALSEAREGQQLGFAERGNLLLQRIFGGDTNPMACRVTAFSLYLSLLEGLDPADVLEAQERDGVKLPALRDRNLCYGESANFFSDGHPFADHRFTLLISNPPWKEPAGDTVTLVDHWAQETGAPYVRRQIAGAFAMRSLKFLTEDGRLSLILPIAQFLGPSSAPFVSYFFDRMLPVRLINLGDLQGRLLFPTAENACHVFIGIRRKPKALGRIPPTETFDYSVPKADLSLRFGRLSLQSADRHQLQTQSVREDPQLLVSLMWGSADDLALWTRLSVRGTLQDFWSGPRGTRRWVNRKGVHFKDKSRPPVDAGPLRNMPFIPVEALRRGVPVLHHDLLTPWPLEQATVAHLDDALMAVFKKPRVLFPDGFSREEHSIRAVYFDRPGSFKSSVGVIAGSPESEPLLRFVAIYLRSYLARYFLMLRSWKMLCERNGVHLKDVEPFPFFTPDQAPDPEASTKALNQIVAFSHELERLPELEQAARYQLRREELDEFVFDYFGLSGTERALVREAVDVLMPSIRPRSYKSLYTPLQHRANSDDIARYASALATELTSWRERMDGVGRFHVSVMASEPTHTGPVGIVRITYESDNTAQASVDTRIDDVLVRETLDALHRERLDSVDQGETLQLLPDTLIWTSVGVYIVRPLTRRGWLTRTALRDAERIVRHVQERERGPTPEVT